MIESEEGSGTASEKDLVTESEEESITKELQHASDDEQPEDRQASPQEPTESGSKPANQTG